MENLQISRESAYSTGQVKPRVKPGLTPHGQKVTALLTRFAQFHLVKFSMMGYITHLSDVQRNGFQREKS